MKIYYAFIQGVELDGMQCLCENTRASSGYAHAARGIIKGNCHIRN